MAVVSLTRVLKTLANHVVLLVTLVSLMLHLMSGMMTSGIELNAITLVNLIMSVGISVEFTSHFLIAFAHESAPLARETGDGDGEEEAAHAAAAAAKAASHVTQYLPLDCLYNLPDSRREKQSQGK